MPATILTVTPSGQVAGKELLVPSGPEGVCYDHVQDWLTPRLKAKKLATAVGDEGGFAPDLPGERETLDLILEAIRKAGYEPGRDVALAIDAAASEWKAESGYKMPKTGLTYTTDELVAFWAQLVEDYPIVSLEDPLDEEDWEGWVKMPGGTGSVANMWNYLNVSPKTATEASTGMGTGVIIGIVAAVVIVAGVVVLVLRQRKPRQMEE